MVDLDSNPTKLIEIVEIGKQLLMTRGALTTFSIANDVAKYFAIIPAAFAATYPVLGALNVMRLTTPESAILSAVIFNALIIIALIPLALRGVRYRAARRRDAAPRQHAHLRGGRYHRAVHRDQGGRRGPGLRSASCDSRPQEDVDDERSSQRGAHADRDDGRDGRDLSPGRDRHRPGRVPGRGEWQPSLA